MIEAVCEVHTFWFEQGYVAYCDHGMVEGCADDDDAKTKLSKLTSSHTVTVEE